MATFLFLTYNGKIQINKRFYMWAFFTNKKKFVKKKKHFFKFFSLKGGGAKIAP